LGGAICPDVVSRVVTGHPPLLPQPQRPSPPGGQRPSRQRHAHTPDSTPQREREGGGDRERERGRERGREGDIERERERGREGRREGGLVHPSRSGLVAPSRCHATHALYTRWGTGDSSPPIAAPWCIRKRLFCTPPGNDTSRRCAQVKILSTTLPHSRARSAAAPRACRADGTRKHSLANPLPRSLHIRESTLPSSPNQAKHTQETMRVDACPCVPAVPAAALQTKHPGKSRGTRHRLPRGFSCLCTHSLFTPGNTDAGCPHARAEGHTHHQDFDQLRSRPCPGAAAPLHSAEPLPGTSKM